MSTKATVLKALQSNLKNYVSGEELSNTLGISRAAVWKAIKALREDGYRIEAVTNKGYSLLPDEKYITVEALRNALPARYRKNDVFIYDTLDSTNAKAKQMALEKSPHGTVIMARQQTHGRGRLGRSFCSPREGIYMSIVIRPSFDMSKSVLVTSAAAVAVSDAISQVCGLPAKIKWVNDVYVHDKKVCGILTEAITDFEMGTIESLAIGIGLNTSVACFPAELKDIAGALEGDYSPAQLGAAVIGNLLDLMDSLESRDFIKIYRERSLVLGKTVKVFKKGYNTDSSHDVLGIPARVLDIDRDGGLVVLYTNGTQETLNTGEISIRL
ncbi:MAG: biotin--[acetyl-CoA-carboxylase] ligase [Clostridiales bacterium]|nr:biotin--[acetyl-CoA-carboxylase] ligase [Clostridiales bacterium]